MIKNKANKIILFGITLIMLCACLLVSCPNKSASASVDEKVEWTLIEGENITDKTLIIALENAKLANNVTTETSLSDWKITPGIMGELIWNIAEIGDDNKTFKLSLSGTPTGTLDTKQIGISIPKSALDAENIDEANGLVVNMRGSTIAVSAKAPGPVDPEPDTPSEEEVEPTISISEISFKGQPREFLSGTIIVSVDGATFKKDISTAENGVESWFENPEAGFTYTLLSIGEVQRDNAKSISKDASIKTDIAKIEINGAFHDETKTDFTYSVKIPASAFNEKVKESKVTAGRGTIKRDLVYKAATWKLFDSAAFTNIVNDDTLSLNIDFTQYATADENGSTNIYEDKDSLDAPILEGDKTLVRLERGLVRKGYKLVGFSEKDSTSSARDNLLTPKYTKTLADLQDGFLIPEGSDVTLYAIWEKDDSKYWKSVDTVTITKEEILKALETSLEDEGVEETEASEGDESSGVGFVLTMHDGITEIPEGYTQSFDFIALPGGRVGGTEDEPKYFEWPVDESFARTYEQTGDLVLHEAIYSDFAIADIPATGGLYAVVKKWADDNGYSFITSSKISVHAVGGVKGGSADRFSVEDPTVICNWANAVLFANAMTGWYNEKHPENQLTYVYVEEDGTPFKDGNSASDKIVQFSIHQGLYGSQLTTTDIDIEGYISKTGFRLPTYTEWLYAASVTPSALDESWAIEGNASYPFAHSYSYISGYNNEDISTDDNIKQYAVYATLYSDDEGTQVVGKYANRKPNLIGLYDMSGNVGEYVEDLAAVPPKSTSNRRFCMGGSYLTQKDTGLSIGSAHGFGFGFSDQKIYAQLNNKMAQGVRLVRTLVD